MQSTVHQSLSILVVIIENMGIFSCLTSRYFISSTQRRVIIDHRSNEINLLFAILARDGKVIWPLSIHDVLAFNQSIGGLIDNNSIFHKLFHLFWILLILLFHTLEANSRNIESYTCYEGTKMERGRWDWNVIIFEANKKIFSEDFSSIIENNWQCFIITI